MISLADVKAYGCQDDLAVVAFEDGRELRAQGVWQGDTVRRIEKLTLSCQDREIAGVSGGVFWAHTGVSQKDLGEYVMCGIELERQVYRYYRQGKIAEAEWHDRFRAFWKIMIKTRQIATWLINSQMPHGAANKVT